MDTYRNAHPQRIGYRYFDAHTNTHFVSLRYGDGHEHRITHTESNPNRFVVAFGYPNPNSNYATQPNPDEHCCSVV